MRGGGGAGGVEGPSAGRGGGGGTGSTGGASLAIEGSGLADATVNIDGRPAAVVPFTYVPRPIVAGVAPATVVQGSAPTVTITGENFGAVTDVLFGSEAATTFTIMSDTLISATVPSSLRSGAVSTTVVSPGAESATTSADTLIVARVQRPGRGPVRQRDHRRLHPEGFRARPRPAPTDTATPSDTAASASRGELARSGGAVMTLQRSIANVGA
ncbi:IPT/TIG domain-containing protein [Microbacterium limosum]|uniref:IPT/TIG domain-containing protein n=1 Tax=Microbacterium limosum TaxID=3079935 RepID=UPI003BF5BCAC